MSRQLLMGGTLLDPERKEPIAGSLLLGDRGEIEAVLPANAAVEDAARVDCTGLQIAPGFIDLHFHGELLFAGPSDFDAALMRASSALVADGTTAYLATTIAWPESRLREYVEQLAKVVTHTRHEGAVPIGLHIEGPWINPDAAGAQPRGAIRPFGPAEVEVIESTAGILRMVTLAPEVEGADLLTDLVLRHDAIASIGHSLADERVIAAAHDRGMMHVTHLFNAMGSMHHRAPGVAGAVLAHDALTCDLICDGAHVHPTMVRAAARALQERAVLISDRIDLPSVAHDDALDDATRAHGWHQLIDDGAAFRLPDGTLAGSTLGLGRALENYSRWSGRGVLDAVAASTLRPARLLGCETERGTLRPGARADLVVLDAACRVTETWIAGRRVHVAARAHPL